MTSILEQIHCVKHTPAPVVKEGNRLTRHIRRHGISHTRIYRIWEGMLDRCSNPKYKGYHNYGGRGITVCDEWKDPAVFFNWALSHGYREDLTIERKDNDGDYSPGNCRWATMKEQTHNTRRNVNITAFGETKCVEEWARDPRVTVGNLTIRARLRVKMMSFEEILTAPHPSCATGRKAAYVAPANEVITQAYRPLADKIIEVLAEYPGQRLTAMDISSHVGATPSNTAKCLRETLAVEVMSGLRYPEEKWSARKNQTLYWLPASSEEVA